MRITRSAAYRYGWRLELGPIALWIIYSPGVSRHIKPGFAIHKRLKVASLAIGQSFLVEFDWN